MLNYCKPSVFPRHVTAFGSRFYNFNNQPVGVGEHNEIIRPHFKVFAQDIDKNGFMDVVAYSLKSGGDIYIMYGMSNHVPNHVFNNSRAQNATAMSCSISDSARDFWNINCPAYLATGKNNRDYYTQWANKCNQAVGLCQHDDLPIRGPWFNNRPGYAFQLKRASKLFPSNKYAYKFCTNTGDHLIQFKGYEGDTVLCFNYKTGTLKTPKDNSNFYIGFCKDTYGVSPGMYHQASGQLKVDVTHGQVFCLSRSTNTLYHTSFGGTILPKSPGDPVPFATRCENSSCEYCNPNNGFCGCPEDWKLNEDGKTCNKICPTYKKLSSDGNSCISLFDLCPSQPHLCTFSEKFRDSLTKYDVRIQRSDEKYLAGNPYSYPSNAIKSNNSTYQSNLRLRYHADGYYRIQLASNFKSSSHLGYFHLDKNIENPSSIETNYRNFVTLKTGPFKESDTKFLFKIDRVSNLFTISPMNPLSNETYYLTALKSDAYEKYGINQFKYETYKKVGSHETFVGKELIPYNYFNFYYKIQLNCPSDRVLSADQQGCDCKEGTISSEDGLKCYPECDEGLTLNADKTDCILDCPEGMMPNVFDGSTCQRRFSLIEDGPVDEETLELFSTNAIYIKSVSQNRALGIPSENFAKGTPTGHVNFDPTNKYHLLILKPFSGSKTHGVVMEQKQGRAFNVNGGTKLNLWGAGDWGNNRMVFYVENGYYKIKNVHTNKCWTSLSSEIVNVAACVEGDVNQYYEIDLMEIYE